MAIRVGITGGIGSGKSTVAKIFAVLGAPVYYADDASKRIMNSDPEVIQLIMDHFSSEAYKEGMLDRSFIAAKVFNNKAKLELLNSLVHPATIRDADNWLSLQRAPYVIKEAALLFESGSYAALDYVIGVSAPFDLRLQRTIARDHSLKEQVIARMNRQIDENIKMKLCDFIVYNDEEQLLIPQVLKLHERFLDESS
ncbi:MAG: dephospho-CoA kinase [Chitinophagaceae bacterium]|nr:MAG: dephospho-CoA kinase [Chitinophagaceae bacterium]